MLKNSRRFRHFFLVEALKLTQCIHAFDQNFPKKSFALRDFITVVNGDVMGFCHHNEYQCGHASI